jgi:DNA-binding transcriptional ArsR family regulator
MKQVIVMGRSIAVCERTRFVYHQSMDVDASLSGIAAAIAEPARARMLCSLMDGHARTSTELATVAEVSPSTASAHLARLKEQHLVNVQAQGKHRYYSIAGASVASALEALMVVAGGSRERFVPNTPSRLRAARTCYDHMAGAVAVSLHDRFKERGWLKDSPASDGAYDLTAIGAKAIESLGIDVDTVRALRRRFACSCLDWSERRPHLAGALGAALLNVLLNRKWVARDLDSRALSVTRVGVREMSTRFGVQF